MKFLKIIHLASILEFWKISRLRPRRNLFVKTLIDVIVIHNLIEFNKILLFIGKPKFNP